MDPATNNTQMSLYVGGEPDGAEDTYPDHARATHRPYTREEIAEMWDYAMRAMSYDDCLTERDRYAHLLDGFYNDKAFAFPPSWMSLKIKLSELAVDLSGRSYPVRVRTAPQQSGGNPPRMEFVLETSDCTSWRSQDLGFVTLNDDAALMSKIKFELSLQPVLSRVYPCDWSDFGRAGLDFALFVRDGGDPESLAVRFERIAPLIDANRGDTIEFGRVFSEQSEHSASRLVHVKKGVNSFRSVDTEVVGAAHDVSIQFGPEDRPHIYPKVSTRPTVLNMALEMDPYRRVEQYGSVRSILIRNGRDLRTSAREWF